LLPKLEETLEYPDLFVDRMGCKRFGQNWPEWKVLRLLWQTEQTFHSVKSITDKRIQSIDHFYITDNQDTAARNE
jgi:hypothetical protein